jgi:hypothetical protein
MERARKGRLKACEDGVDRKTVEFEEFADAPIGGAPSPLSVTGEVDSIDDLSADLCGNLNEDSVLQTVEDLEV